MSKADHFVFKKRDTVGASDAEEDSKFLEACYVDTGDLEALADCSDPRRLVLGRTGSGKSALLRRLKETKQHAIQVEPESLALAYISNSTILSFVSQLGVKLDIFFKLLWRHVFAIEIIKHRFNIESSSDGRSLITKLRNLILDLRSQQAIQYLEKWGKSFWEETDYRIKEVTNTLEDALKAGIHAELPNLKLTLDSVKKMSEETKTEVVTRAQQVVNSVQIRELSDVIRLLDQVLEDPQQPHYVVIDRLDEDWVEEKLRLRLLRALIETVREFRAVRNVKVIIAMRIDLLERVYRFTRDSGFQEEKYEDLYLLVSWTPEQLDELLSLRVNHLVKMRYTKQRV